MSKRNVNLRDEWRVTSHEQSRIAPPATRHPSHQYPVALTIAGSDSGGGAGIQADLKTFAAFGVHGASAITCLTAQNPRRVLAVESTPAKMLRQQIEAVFQELRPAAVKTGMLLSVENVRIVANFFRSQRRPPLVVDPVMVSTSGASLLAPAAIKVLQERLLPLATLVTPNLRETEILTGGKITSVENMRAAAREIHTRFGCAALVKGGHWRGTREAVDIFFDGRAELLLNAPVHQRCADARHRLHLFGGHHGGAGVGPRFAPSRRAGQKLHHSSHRRQLSRRETLCVESAVSLRHPPLDNQQRNRLPWQSYLQDALTISEADFF
jgi:hydroxymethylpyrimidine/phosphomethylpyrimidine kinase